MTICPCCGHKSNAPLADGCAACGARPVGEALPKPERELPSYARSLALVVTGFLIWIAFITQFGVAFAQNVPTLKTYREAFRAWLSVAAHFWVWIAAGETAAWRLKWAAIPVTLLLVFGSRKIYRSIVAAPARFCGRRHARAGYFASLAVPAMILVLIGVTVPARLEHRQIGIKAGEDAHAYRIDRAFDEYREKFGGLPDSLTDLTRRLPDEDGSLAAALKSIDASGYRPGAELAAVPKQKPQTLRGAAIRNASIAGADDSITERLSFTNYELALPGPDKQMGTDDDQVLRDGVIYKASDMPRHAGAAVPLGKSIRR